MFTHHFYSMCVIIMKRLSIFLTLHFSLVVGQSLILFKNRQEDCDTQCLKGLVSGSDTVRFTAQVQFSEDPNMNIMFFVKRKYERNYQLLSFYNIKEDCPRNKHLTCTDVSRNVINITMRQAALSELSEASIYGKLMTSPHSEIKSETQLFPLINNPSNTTGRLILNEQEITKDNEPCLSAKSGNELNIVFKCESKVLPCLIDVVFDDGETHVRGIGQVKCNRKIKSQNSQSFTIYYGACKLEHTTNIKRCIISVTEQSSSKLEQVVIYLVFASLAMLLILITVIITNQYVKRFRNKLHLKQQLECKKSNEKEFKHFLPSHVDQSTQAIDRISLSTGSSLYISAAEDNFHSPSH